MATTPRPKLIDESTPVPTAANSNEPSVEFFGMKKSGDGYEVVKAFIQGERVVKFESITPGIQPMNIAAEDLYAALRRRMAEID